MGQLTLTMRLVVQEVGTEALARTESRLASLTRTARTFAVGFGAIAGAVAVRGVADAVRTFASFEEQIRRAAAVMTGGIDRFEELEAAARSLGESTVFTAREVADAFFFLGQAGLDVDQSLSAVVDVLNLAQIGAIDLGRASDIATDIMTAFGLEVQDLGNIIDIITATFTSFNTDVNLLASGLFKVGPVAGQLGISLEEVSAALGVLSGAGIKGEEAGTALRNIFIRLINPAGEAAQLLAQMGITARDANGSFLSLTDIVGQFERAMVELGPDAERAIAEIIGTRAFAAMLRLIDSMDEGEKSLGGFTEALQGVEGAAVEMTDFINDSTAFTLRELEAQINELKLQLGEAMIPVVEELIVVFQENRDSIVDFITTIAELIPVILFMVQGIMNLVAAYKALDEQLGEFSGILPILIGLMIALAAPWLGLVILASLFGDELVALAQIIGSVIVVLINISSHILVLTVNIAGAIRQFLVWIKVWDDIGRGADKLNERLDSLINKLARVRESRVAQGLITIGTTTADVGEAIEQNFQRGTRRVPRTGLAVVHAGEEITNPRLGQEPTGGGGRGGINIERVEIHVDASDRDMTRVARSIEKEFRKSLHLLSLR